MCSEWHKYITGTWMTIETLTGLSSILLATIQGRVLKHDIQHDSEEIFAEH